MKKLWENLPEKTAFSEIFQGCMLADKERVLKYKEAIDKCVKKGSIVVDLGTGSGILAKLAADAGAGKVYAIEADPKMVKMARRNLSGSNNAKVVKGNIYNFKLKEKADVVIGEMINTACILEEQIPAFNHAIKHILKKDGIFIPSSIKSTVQLINFKFNTYGVQLRWPLLYWKDDMEPIKTFSKHLVYDKIVFDRENDLYKEVDIKTEMLKSGTVNAALITSYVETAKGVILKPKESITPRMIVPLRRDVIVSKGQCKNINIKLRYNSDWGQFVVELD